MSLSRPLTAAQESVTPDLDPLEHPLEHPRTLHTCLCRHALNLEHHNRVLHVRAPLFEWTDGKRFKRCTLEGWQVSPCTGSHVETLLKITEVDAFSAAHIVQCDGKRYDLCCWDPTRETFDECRTTLPRFPAGLTNDQAEEHAIGNGGLSAVFRAEEVTTNSHLVFDVQLQHCYVVTLLLKRHMSGHHTFGCRPNTSPDTRLPCSYYYSCWASPVKDVCRSRACTRGAATPSCPCAPAVGQASARRCRDESCLYCRNVSNKQIL